jgi:ABC-type phosphate transport system substrate-binding protein
VSYRHSKRRNALRRQIAERRALIEQERQLAAPPPRTPAETRVAPTRHSRHGRHAKAVPLWRKVVAGSGFGLIAFSAVPAVSNAVGVDASTPPATSTPATVASPGTTTTGVTTTGVTAAAAPPKAAPTTGALRTAAMTTSAPTTFTMAAVGTTTTAAAPTASVPTLTLTTGGSTGVERQSVAWRDAMYDAGVDMGFTSLGTSDARDQYAAGGFDAVFSGTPFTSAQLAKIPGGAKNVIAVPVHVGAAAFLLRKPDLLYSDVQTPPGCADDPNWDPALPCDVVRTFYTGPIRIPADNLGAMTYANKLGGLANWANPAILAAMNTPDLAWKFFAGEGPVYVSRADADATTYYVRSWVAAAAPNVVKQVKAAEPNKAIDPPTEDPMTTPTRRGLLAQIAAVSDGNNPATGGGFNNVMPGVLTATSPSGLVIAKEAFPRANLTLVEVQNKHGDWVAPTAEAINKAVDAGGASPLAAATTDIPGAYPLVWIDNLYLQATGLSIDKTNAEAGLIRYIVTDGQAGGAALGEGRLPVALVAQALSTADAFVKSNCVGADRHVETDAMPGSFTPNSAGILAIGPMAHCVATVAATTTTTTPTTTTTTTARPAPATTRPAVVQHVTVTRAPVTAPVVETAPPTTTTTTAVPTTVPVKVTTIGSNGGAMPLSAPSNGRGGLDRLSTMSMGVGLLWVSRRTFKVKP